MRASLDLGGRWRFVADLDPKYHAIHGGYERPEADRRHWLEVRVPGVWQTYAERYAIFEGVCWFSREFEAPAHGAGAIARLRFGAVNYLARVYLNGELAGEHEGGCTSFTIDVTGKLRPGPNHLAVQVDNRAATIKWPPCLGYFNYGGIHRGVSLEIDQGPTLDELAVAATPAGAEWALKAEGEVLLPAAGLAVRVNGGKPAAVGGDGSFAADAVLAEAPAWSPETPHLVPVVVELVDRTGQVLDRREFRYGLRTLTVRDSRIHLNGRPYPLRGICYVYDSPTTGLTMTPAQLDTDLGLMKEAGCNAVRCHYPMDEAFYAACDRLGLLVWIEPPVYCYHPRDNETGTRFADPAWLALAQSYCS